LGISRLPQSPVFALSIHADYRCHNSGVCCSVGWDVPIELPVYRSLDEAVTAGRLRPAPEAAGLAPFIVEPDAPEDGAVFERTSADQCVFLDTGTRLCIVHRDLGADALPVTCRVFPRVAVCDPRGTFVGLSHFCPTAASLLFRDDVPLRIVAAPPAFPPADYDGLSVSDEELPPLLHPRMLMDLEGYTVWEAHMVGRCDIERSPESVLATLARDAAELRRWKPGGVSLPDAVRALSPVHVEAAPPTTLAPSRALHRQAMRAVPRELKPPRDEAGLDQAFQGWVVPAWPSLRAPVVRYIASKAFASWTAYQGRGVATIVRGIEAAVALVRVEAARQCRDAGRTLDAGLLLEAFRSADFILNHLAVGDELAIGWSAAEKE
jgi:hypothetical protein